MTHFVVYNYACKFEIGLSIYIKSRKVRRVPSLDRGGELYFSTEHKRYFCLLIIFNFNTVALIFSIAISHGTAHNKFHSNRDLPVFGVLCGRNFSKPIFLKFYFSYLSIHIS